LHQMAPNLYTDIVARLRTGDASVFEEIYKSLFHKLYAFCKAYLLSKENAEEVTQEVFVVLWENRLDLPEDTHLHAFLFTVARRKCLNFLRTSKFRSAIVINGIDREQERNLNIYALADNSFEKIFTNDIMEALHTAINQLPDSCRDYFVMSKLQGMKYTEIAAFKNVSVKNVEYHISKALSILRKKLTSLHYLCLLTFVIFNS